MRTKIRLCLILVTLLLFSGCGASKGSGDLIMKDGWLWNGDYKLDFLTTYQGEQAYGQLRGLDVSFKRDYALSIESAEFNTQEISESNMSKAGNMFYSWTGSYTTLSGYIPEGESFKCGQVTSSYLESSSDHMKMKEMLEKLPLTADYTLTVGSLKISAPGYYAYWKPNEYVISGVLSVYQDEYVESVAEQALTAGGELTVASWSPKVNCIYVASTTKSCYIFDSDPTDLKAWDTIITFYPGTDITQYVKEK